MGVVRVQVVRIKRCVYEYEGNQEDVQYFLYTIDTYRNVILYIVLTYVYYKGSNHRFNLTEHIKVIDIITHVMVSGLHHPLHCIALLNGDTLISLLSHCPKSIIVKIIPT